MLLPKQQAPFPSSNPIAATPCSGKGNNINTSNNVECELTEEVRDKKPLTSKPSPSAIRRTPKRTDSLDPETKCRGVTARAKSCRNPSPHMARSYQIRSKAVPAEEDYFCHHHKSQAAVAAADKSPSTTVATSAPVAEDEQPAPTSRLPASTLPSTPPRKPIRSSRAEHGLVTPLATPVGSLADRLGLLDIPVPHPYPAQRATTGQHIHQRNPCAITTPPPSPTIRKCHSMPLPGTASLLLFSRRSTTSIPRASSPPSSSFLQMLTSFIQALPSSSSNPTTAASLLARLAKSLASPSAYDTKPGFIYILRPLSPAPCSSQKVRIKIGRTNNVPRRLTEHRRQCAYEPELLACFPVTGSLRLVEGLIHAALRGVKQEEEGKGCGGCGRRHKEWYEVERTREAVGVVDEVVSFAVGWAGNFVSAWRKEEDDGI